jgi:hypothetical protein
MGELVFEGLTIYSMKIQPSACVYQESTSPRLELQWFSYSGQSQIPMGYTMNVGPDQSGFDNTSSHLETVEYVKISIRHAEVRQNPSGCNSL